MKPHYLAPLFDPKSLLVYVPPGSASFMAALLKTYTDDDIDALATYLAGY